MTIETEWLDYEVVVVGSGGAGAQAAYAAAEAGSKVLLISKDPLGCSDTKICEGIATVRQSGSDDDTEETLSENVKMAGADLPIKSITDTFAKDSKSAYDRYRLHGLRPSINKEKSLPNLSYEVILLYILVLQVFEFFGMLFKFNLFILII